MEKLSQSRLASVLTMLVGVWLLVSPLFISITGGALVNVMIVGGIFAVAGLIQLFWVNSLPSWVNGLAAIWLFISAFAFSVSTAMAWNEAVSAVAVFILSVWDGAEISQVQHDRRHQAGV
ncbi:MAG TPA: hypothetical protein VFK11_04325 [Candidatus Saccharimonadales bacterium]|nr:hypothetical protein [Candidatus Saccharimonadales bacterium]